VRLKVAYKTPEALLSEVTRSVGRGGVTIESKKTLPAGTRFIFELHAQGITETVEIYGEVLKVSPSLSKGRYLLDIRYDAPTDRRGIDRLIQRIFDAHKFEKVRKHPRIPISLRAQDVGPGGATYVVRDISRGGLGIEAEALTLPRTIKVGTPFLLKLGLSIGPLVLHGEVAWTFTPPKDRRVLNPSMGVAFGKLRPDTLERLDRILSLRGLPPPPWSAEVSFGLDAVGRMP
jgi:hypothetical protein